MESLTNINTQEHPPLLLLLPFLFILILCHGEVITHASHWLCNDVHLRHGTIFQQQDREPLHVHEQVTRLLEHAPASVTSAGQLWH
jgi:hypothetical protein